MQVRPKYFILRVTLLVILLIFTIVFSLFIWLGYDDLRIIAIDNKVEATYYDIYDVSSDPFTGRGKKINLKYEYFDENGRRYEGTNDHVYFKSTEDAQKHIGESVWIYIDDDGHSVLASSNPQPWRIILLTACTLLASIIVFVFMIYLPSKKIKKLRN